MTTTPMALENPAWAADVLDLIERFCREGRRFTSDDLHVVGEPTHPNQWGAVIRAAKRRRLIVPVETRSTSRRAGHGRIVRTWAPNPDVYAPGWAA